MNLDPNSILEQLIAGGVIALLFGLIFPLWIKKLARPRSVAIEIDPAFENKIEINDSKSKITFDILLTLANNSNITINYAYWKIIIPSEIEFIIPENVEFNECEGFKIIGESIKVPIFPNRSFSLVTLKGHSNSNKLKNLKIYYEISTEFGLYPRGINKFYDKTGFITFTKKTLDHLGQVDFSDVIK